MKNHRSNGFFSFFVRQILRVQFVQACKKSQNNSNSNQRAFQEYYIPVKLMSEYTDFIKF